MSEGLSRLKLVPAVAWTLRALAAALVAYGALHLPAGHALLLVEFAGLVLVARALRVPFEGTTLELEAAALFPAVLLSRSWPAGVILAAVILLARAVERLGAPTLADVDDTTDLVLAYGVSSFFAVSLGGAVAGVASSVLLFGATLLVFFFVRLVLGALRATMSPGARLPELVRAAAFQFVTLVLLSPVVGLIVLVQPTYGFGATLLAFFSVGLVSAALRNVAQSRRRTAEMARQTQELETLREISRIYAGTVDEELLFEKLFQAFRKMAPIAAMAAASYEDDPEGQAVATLHGAATIERRALLAWLANHRERETPYTKTPPNPTVSASAERELVLNPAHRFQILLPLRTPELIAGLLAVESDDAALVQPSTVQELTVLADHVALSLQDRGLKRQMQTVNERLQGRADTLHRILEVSNELKSHLTVELVLSNIVRAVSGSLGFRVVLLSLYDRTENVFDHRAQVGLDAQWETLARQRVPREEIARWFSERFRISKSYYVSHLDRVSPDDTTGFLRRRKVRGGGEWTSHDLLFIPLTAADQLVGVLQVDQPKSGRVPTLEDVQALEIFANQAVNAIQSARAYETTRQMSVKDSLTDAFNHRHFQETLYRELTRHERSGQSLALLMIDLDDFKKINDRWGHPVGDLVLRGLVEELAKGVREMDTLARYGGEEFAVILPETNPDKGYLVADRLRSRVASRLFVSPDLSHPLTVTISIGLATFPEDANAKRALIERADQALYQAKRSGKNCVVTAASLSDLRVG